MYCKECGSKLDEEVKFCPNCGAKVKEDEKDEKKEKKHDKPKCTCCGYEGDWVLGPLLRPMDYVLGAIFLVMGIVPGLIYIGVVAAIRNNPDNREKVCPKCNAKNLWTFFY